MPGPAKCTLAKFIEKANKIHNFLYSYEKTLYNGSFSEVIIICPIHGEFKQVAANHLIGSGCQTCAKMCKFRTSHDDFIKRCEEIHNNFYDYSLLKYNGSTKYVTIICPIHGQFEQLAQIHLGGSGCKICGRSRNILARKKTIEAFIEESNLIHNFRYNYSLFKYEKTFIQGTIICPIHGEFKQTPEIHLMGCGCQICQLSKGEERIKNWFIKNKIEYILGKKFPGCVNKKSLFFDFYIPNYNLCIEYDGVQHFKVIKMWGGEEKLSVDKIRDEIKNRYCIDNKIKLLRIPYWNYDIIEILLEQEFNQKYPL